MTNHSLSDFGGGTNMDAVIAADLAEQRRREHRFFAANRQCPFCGVALSPVTEIRHAIELHDETNSGSVGHAVKRLCAHCWQALSESVSTNPDQAAHDSRDLLALYDETAGEVTHIARQLCASRWLALYTAVNKRRPARETHFGGEA